MDLIVERCPILIQMSTGVGLSVPFTEREALVELRPRVALAAALDRPVASVDETAALLRLPPR
jgi:uncharacterized protein (DUF849 family)